MTVLPEGWAFEDPGPNPHTSRVRRDFTALVEHPGRWARIGTTSSSSGTQSRRSAEKRHGGQWESTTRPDPDNPKRRLVYLRYLGPDTTNKTTPLRPGPQPQRQIVDLPDPRPTPTREPFGICTCGKEILDADAWGQHNQTVANPKAHKLNRRAS